LSSRRLRLDVGRRSEPGVLHPGERVVVRTAEAASSRTGGSCVAHAAFPRAGRDRCAIRPVRFVVPPPIQA
jgi:hypothetical protein